MKAKTFFQMRFENFGIECNTPLPGVPTVPCNGEDLAAMDSGQIKVLPPPPPKRR